MTMLDDMQSSHENNEALSCPSSILGTQSSCLSPNCSICFSLAGFLCVCVSVSVCPCVRVWCVSVSACLCVCVSVCVFVCRLGLQKHKKQKQKTIAHIPTKIAPISSHFLLSIPVDRYSSTPAPQLPRREKKDTRKTKHKLLFLHTTHIQLTHGIWRLLTPISSSLERNQDHPLSTT